MKLFLFDLETTGTDISTCGVHQLSGKVIIDGEIRETFDYHVQPKEGCVINPDAMKVCGIDPSVFPTYEPMHSVYFKVVSMLDRYVSKYDKQDKFFLVGFNNSRFDDLVFRQWFSDNGNKYFGSYFWSNSFDCMVLATPKLAGIRHQMTCFKQFEVAKALGVNVDESKLHDSEYDIELCHSIYDSVCGIY